uniref:Uncharacterized protein n=1 Tax=Timema bartmani TaxID=61472 RepID=A0A7R9EP95_9NEOP|nr:unnamed protein product [Timema bartmani]
MTKDLHKDQEDSDEGDEDYDSNEIENVPKSESDLDDIEGYQIATQRGEKEVVVEEKESTENDEPETAGASAGESESGEEESSESESVSDLEGKTKNESGEHQRLEGLLKAAETNLETQNPEAALKMFNQIILMVPGSLRALLGRTRSLDKLGDIHHSNALLDQTIQAYLNVLQMKDLLSDTLFKEIAYRCINRIIFRAPHQLETSRERNRDDSFGKCRTFSASSSPHQYHKRFVSSTPILQLWHVFLLPVE